MDQRRRSAMSGTLPHPDHFDPEKFGPNGMPIGTGTGRKSKLRPEDVEQVLFLAQVVRVAEQDLADYLHAKGFESHAAQLHVLNELRKGWRPKR